MEKKIYSFEELYYTADWREPSSTLLVSLAKTATVDTSLKFSTEPQIIKV
jgi:hypothetical protein